MTPDELWRRHLDSLDDRERNELIMSFRRMTRESSAMRTGDAVEYLLLLNAGKAASMPDMPIWA